VNQHAKYQGQRHLVQSYCLYAETDTHTHWTHCSSWTNNLVGDDRITAFYDSCEELPCSQLLAVYFCSRIPPQ